MDEFNEQTADEPTEFTEPEEGDYTSEDYCRWWQYGKLVLEISPEDDHCKALRQHMDKQRYWPNCWIISDHGNAHLIDLSTK